MNLYIEKIEMNSENKFFKTCPMCGHVWQTRKDLLEDPDTMIIGYQANFNHLELDLFLFNHLICKGTFALSAINFIDLYDGPIYSRHLTGTSLCPGHCLQQDNLQACPRQCECAYIRNIIQIIKSWPVQTSVDAVKAELELSIAG